MAVVGRRGSIIARERDILAPRAGSSMTSIYNSSHNFVRLNRIKSTEFRTLISGDTRREWKWKLRRGFCRRWSRRMRARPFTRVYLVTCSVRPRHDDDQTRTIRIRAYVLVALRNKTVRDDKSISPLTEATFRTNDHASRRVTALQWRATWIIKSDGALCLCVCTTCKGILHSVLTLSFL